MTTHCLKLEGVYFEAALKGIKPFEIRFNDRGFQKGDKIILQELGKSVTNRPELTSRELEGTILYVLNYMQKENYVVFSYKLNRYVNCVPTKEEK